MLQGSAVNFVYQSHHSLGALAPELVFLSISSDSSAGSQQGGGNDQ